MTDNTLASYVEDLGLHPGRKTNMLSSLYSSIPPGKYLKLCSKSYSHILFNSSLTSHPINDVQ